MVLAEFGNGQVFWSLVWFTFFFMWVWLLVILWTDLFRSPDLSGWGKAAWALFMLAVPYLGAFVYVIARGSGIGERKMMVERQREEMMSRYIAESARPATDVDQLAKLATLRSEGVITDDEYEQLKAKVSV